MINKSKIIVFVAFLGTLFFMTMFAGGTDEVQRIVTRDVTFMDGHTREQISKETVELGKDVRVPLVPEHSELEFDGWYDEEGNRVTDFSSILANMILTARYSGEVLADAGEEDEEAIDTFIPIRRPIATTPATSY